MIVFFDLKILKNVDKFCVFDFTSFTIKLLLLILLILLLLKIVI